MGSIIQMLRFNSPPVVMNEATTPKYRMRFCVAVLMPWIHFICTFNKKKKEKATVLSEYHFIKIQQQNQLHLRLKVYFGIMSKC